MSTDSPIPERWREKAIEIIAPLVKTHPDALCEFAKGAESRNGHGFMFDGNRVEGLLVLECGKRLAAESLVRDLARYARHDCDLREHPDAQWPCTCGLAELLSQIPKELMP